MLKIDNPTATSSPTWRTLEAFIREQVQTCLQRVLEEEVDELLGRGRHERRSPDAAGYRNGYGKPRRVALMNGTITVRRPRVRGLDARFESRILPLFQRQRRCCRSCICMGCRAATSRWRCAACWATGRR